jgi:hypothetical protein
MLAWGPRDETELELVFGLVRVSYHYATGAYCTAQD